MSVGDTFEEPGEFEKTANLKDYLLDKDDQVLIEEPNFEDEWNPAVVPQEEGKKSHSQQNSQFDIDFEK